MNDGASKWSVPGSLLIAGEYIVTEIGGPGVAAAAGKRATLSVSSVSGSEKLQLERTGTTTAEIWSPVNSEEDESLMSAVYGECLSSGLLDGNLSVKLSVDTSRFYDGRGQKLGFGSSAAAAVLYTRGLLGTENIDTISSIALRAHRRWQQGRGSGYDILTSVHGGVGLFRGGKNPEWSPLKWPSELRYWLIRGPGPVNSSVAVKKYQQWLEKLNLDWDSVPVLSDIKSEMEFFQKALEEAFEPDPLMILETINRMAEYGSLLGRAIDVPAIPLMPEDFPKQSAPWYRPGSAAAKCLGAGDEIVLLAVLPDGLTSMEKDKLFELARKGNARELKIDPHGLIEGIVN